MGALLLRLALGGWSFVKGFLNLLKKLPWWVWVAIAVVIALWLGWRWHEGQVKKADAAGYQRRVTEDQRRSARIVARSHVLSAQTQTQQAQANSNVEVTYVQKADDSHARADSLRVRVPDALRCPGGNTAVRVDSGAAPSQAAGTDVPSVAAIPWKPLVDHGEQCDLYRAQVEGWQSWYADQSAIYEAWRKQFAKTLTTK